MRTDDELYIATKYWHRVQHVSIYEVFRGPVTGRCMQG